MGEHLYMFSGIILVSIPALHIWPTAMLCAGVHECQAGSRIAVGGPGQHEGAQEPPGEGQGRRQEGRQGVGPQAGGGQVSPSRNRQWSS